MEASRASAKAAFQAHNQNKRAVLALTQSSPNNVVTARATAFRQSKLQLNSTMTTLASQLRQGQS